MSKLYYTESGHVIPTLCEELTQFRRARKVLELPATTGPGTLYFLARPHQGSEWPLRLKVNGTEISPIRPGAVTYTWYEVRVEAGLLRAGVNTFEFWTEATAMNAWSLAIEGGHARPQSWISDDGGAGWRNERMGYLGAQRGEYAVRVRLQEGADPGPPALVFEDPANPRLESLRRIMPAQAMAKGPLLARVRAISSWLSSSWEHTSSARAAQYAPWDAETILEWGRTRRGHHGQRPIAMCVHYAVAFVSCCQALGIAARCAALTGTPNGSDGHFVAEVWFPEYDKWVMVDPNSDAMAWKEGKPLSIREIQQAGKDLAPLLEWGPGSQFQRGFPHMVEFAENNLKKGICFRHRSLWWRADFLSHPELSPPGHGSTSYCETGLVWEARDRERFGMFPHFAEPAYFEAPPGL